MSTSYVRLPSKRRLFSGLQFLINEPVKMTFCLAEQDMIVRKELQSFMMFLKRFKARIRSLVRQTRERIALDQMIKETEKLGLDASWMGIEE